MSDIDETKSTNTGDLSADNLTIHNLQNVSEPEKVETEDINANGNSTVDEVAVETEPVHKKPKEEDEESALTNIDFTIQDVNENLNLSEYCISSDADTEKMESDSNITGLDGKTEEMFPPKLSSLVQETENSELEPKEEHTEDSKRALEEDKDGDNDDHKKRKLVEEEDKPEHTKHHGEEDEDDNEVGDEGEADDVLEEDEDEVEDEQIIPTEPSMEGITELKEQTPEIEPTVSETHEAEEELLTLKIEQEQQQEKAVPDAKHSEHNEEEMSELEAKQSEEVEKPIDEAANKESVTEAQDVAEEEHEGDEEDSEDVRLKALKEITDIEYKFAALRQKLYETKLYKLEIELQMCLEGSHPELRGYYEKIANIRDYKLRRAYQRQKYELNCIDTETRATRTFTHQDYYKRVNDLKNNLLDNTTQQWYDINKERRDMDIVIPEVKYHVPVKMANKTLSCITGYAGTARQLLPGEPISEDLECENIQFRYKNNPVDKLEVIVDRMRLNNELSDLQGLRKFFQGFPGAPSLNSLRDSEINDDFDLLHSQLQ